MTMNAEARIKNAQQKFIEGCWEKFKSYYMPYVSNKNIILYGNGIYGKFMFAALSEIGYRNNIKYIINDFINETGTYEGVSIVKYSDISINDKSDIVVVGIQNSDKLIEKFQKDGHNYIFADSAQSFYQDNLMGSVYHCINMSVINDVFYRIRYYYEKMIDKEEYIISLYKEDLSRQIIKNRLDFYKTGDCKYIDSTPVSASEYYSQEYYHITNNEVYVDCGAYDGDSIIDFIRFVDGRYDKIIGFEPDSISFEKLKKNVSEHSNIKIFNYASGKENGEVRFESTGTLGSSLSDIQGDIVEVKKLDDLLRNERITLIKIDVEGAELDTLEGLRSTITSQKPKMAVCIYHMMNDIIDIIEYISSLVSEYKFIVRQHVNSILDTVLYAEVDK